MLIMCGNFIKELTSERFYLWGRSLLWGQADLADREGHAGQVRLGSWQKGANVQKYTYISQHIYIFIYINIYICIDRYIDILI